MTMYEENEWRVIVKLAEWFPWGMPASALRLVLDLPATQPQGILRSLENQGVVELSHGDWYLKHSVGTALLKMPGLERHCLIGKGRSRG